MCIRDRAYLELQVQRIGLFGDDHDVLKRLLGESLVLYGKAVGSSRQRVEFVNAIGVGGRHQGLSLIHI